MGGGERAGRAVVSTWPLPLRRALVARVNVAGSALALTVGGPEDRRRLEHGLYAHGLVVLLLCWLHASATMCAWLRRVNYCTTGAPNMAVGAASR